ncbi:RagB/SusD family nutrient uptake outer membrane protein [Flammeovirga aprica]|uniref:RagB/SusD family nutrient uptake outer membrane protein n=1 Tax=Flammeovirga aprica JL-4 TaxID=694437 RepID=A0A7X9P2H2_9BACT|nr:RagB/SusD family nutrient uptake outer membrane protein [Flammeovirga aprica]NME68120.1 RagB/SusD family nutrient uptake outer membrane protein [Flammeovirga aprica JL-4]
MRLKNILIAGITTALSVTSCHSVLDVDPTQSQTASTFFATSAEAQQALFGVYEKLRSDYKNTVPNSNPILEAALGDDAHVAGSPDGNDMLSLQRMSHFKAFTNSATALAAWSKCYEAIQRANTLLANYDQINFVAKDGDLKQTIRGEATFLRAHFYFELVRYFENIPLILEPLEGESWTSITQVAPEEVYAQIAKDILTGIAFMTDEVEPEFDGQLTKYAAMAELVKVYMFYTGYYKQESLPVAGSNPITKDMVISYAEEIINSGNYELEENYADLFNENGNFSKEAIFEITFVNTGSGHWGDWSFGSIFCQMSGPREHSSARFAPGWGIFAPTRDLEAQFEEGDTRKGATIVYAKELIDLTGKTYELNYQFTSMHANKYTTHFWNKAGSETPLNWAQNYHYLRLADVYLLAAELYLDTNNGKATEFVNIVRERAGLEALSSVTLEDIQHERRVELAFEGHRYFDVLRRGLAEADAELSVSNYQLVPPTDTEEKYIDDSGYNFTGDVSQNGDPSIYEVSFDPSKKGFLPIPQYELDLHSALKQNDGYN